MITLKPGGGVGGGGVVEEEEEGDGGGRRGRAGSRTRSSGKNVGVAGERGEKSMPLGNCILQRYFVH